MTSARRIPAELLERFTRECLAAVGLPAEDAAAVAELMCEADLNGSDGHGIFRLPQYIKRIESGGINVNPDIRFVREQPASAVIDGDDAMGHLVMRHAARVACGPCCYR
jgi:LDH2 family malate/lactate/ureidoglycolate dehydrogenase